MYQKAVSMYYSLAIFVVGATFFVIQPSTSHEMTVWQNDIKQQFATAWIQTIGDQPWFEEIGMIYEGVASFYEESSEATIALFTEPESDEDLYYVFSEVYNTFAKSFDSNKDHNSVALTSPSLPNNAEEFMVEDPIYNIVPYRTVVKTIDEGIVAGVSIDQLPVNLKQAWVTIRDNYTGQLYCLAIYNDTVNKYLGPCKYDDYY